MAKRIGTRTKGQTTRRSGVAQQIDAALSPALIKGAPVFAASTNIQAYRSAPSPGTYDTYRIMRSNPTIALARAALFAPIKASPWMYEAKDGVPDERVKFIQEQFDAMRAQLLRDSLRSIEYGWQPFERVYAYDRDTGLVVLARAKPLLPDDSAPIVDKETSALLGVQNGQTTLSITEAVVLSYDSECDDPYGRSIYENIRAEAWWPWRDAAYKFAQYATKGAGVIPMIRYPLGKANDASGAEVDNSENAANILRTLGIGMGVAMPNQIDPSFEDLLRAGANVQDLMAWQISFIETRAGVGGELLESMRHYEKLMVRGMYQPERMLLEGQFGTKADASSHGDIGVAISSEIMEWLVSEINRQLVNPLLAINFGSEAIGSVYIKPSPIIDEDKAFIRALMDKTLSANPDLLMGVADFDAMLDSVNIPKSQEVVDTQQPAPVDVPGTVKKVITEGTGDVVADQALNGAQVQSMVEVVVAVASKNLPPESAKGILKIAFPSSPDALIDKVINASAAFVAPQQPAPTPRMASLAKRVKQFRDNGIV